MRLLNRTGNCLHELVEEQARRAPDRIAVVSEGERLSYGDLERRADELAARLRERGAGPEARIALLMERSASLVVGILGILKAGAAYVPIDPAYPAARIDFLLRDSGASMVLTERGIDDAQPASGRTPTGAAAPENLAYVVYTSGSTGHPKGVCIEHRNIVSYVLAVCERLQLGPNLHYAMLSTIAADLGNTVLFPALVTGGCLHVISRERAESPPLLAEYFAREAIDVLKIAPSHLAALQGASRPERVMPRRRLVLGGEACALDRIAQLRAMAPGCEIHNHYGPTEATVGVLTYRVDGSLPGTRTGTLPLGKPLPHSRVYVLDANARPCAQGEPGEIFIGGAGVARGYLNRPDLTAERFLADPFAAQAGARLYRTGDLGRLLPDGSIEFCGRMDHQVKIGGYRIEPGEIEQALRSHAGVRDAVVLAREDGAGGKRLVGYVVPEPADPPLLAPESLRQHLDDRLPRHMVPHAFVLLERFPLTPNGKIDRLALPPAAEARKPCAASMAPRSQTEMALAAIWSELLGVRDIGIADDFFDLGGQSLVAMRMVARVRDAFGVDLQLRNLFERPTVAGLAEVVDGLAWARESGRPPASAHGREEVKL